MMTAGEERGPRDPRGGAQAQHAADPAPDLAGRVLRWAGLGGVVLIALVAAVTSYDHLRSLGEWAGEGWRAWIVPLSVDGLLITASMTAAARHRGGRNAGALCWVALVVALAATLAGNVASAEDSVIARVYAGWPAVALLLAHELLMRELRRTAVTTPPTAESDPGMGEEQVTQPAADLSFVAVNSAPPEWSERAAGTRRAALSPVAPGVSQVPGPTGAGGTPHAPVTGEGDTRPAQPHAMEGAAREAARLPDEAARRAARELYLRKAAQGVPPSGAELGRLYDRSERWGRAQAAAAHAARAAAAPPPGTPGGTVANLPRHRVTGGDAA